MFHLFDPRGRWTTSWCVRHLVVDVKSPDGRLSAQAVEFPAPLVLNFTAVAIVKPGHTPAKDDEVLVADTPHGGIKLDWKGPDHLEILVSSASIVTDSKPEPASVKIDLVKVLVP